MLLRCVIFVLFWCVPGAFASGSASEIDLDLDMVVLGEEGQSEPIPMSSSQHEYPSPREVYIGDVGDVYALRFDAIGQTYWKCEEVVVHQGDTEKYSFDCSSLLTKEDNSETYYLVPPLDVDSSQRRMLTEVLRNAAAAFGREGATVRTFLAD